MSTIDPIIQSRIGPEHRPSLKETSKSRQPVDSRPEPSSTTTTTSPSKPTPMSEASGRREPEKPDTAREVLQRVAERALEHPPKDIQKLTASAAKFLLINLEPALRLAEELRQSSVERSGHAMNDMLLDDRQDRAVRLLSDTSR